MEPLIAISTINDFLFCPRSLYMHVAAGDISPKSYQDTPQINGNEAHAAVDERRYSNRKNILQGMNIYSEELGIQGKLDTFDTETGELVERKAKISQVYEGYYMQLYAEYFCLLEMGYRPKKLAFYSMKNNKKYKVKVPAEKETHRLKEIITEMQNFTPEKLLAHHCANCDNNIYAALSW
jgi:CRISPR-associated protein Cas4